jgi:phospholipid/cholesterol/gamma-HCH transport system substrate-binding protein
MPRTRSLAWSELKLGIIGVVSLVLLTAIILAVGGEGGFWASRYPLKTRFNDAQGIKAGAVVRLSGKEIGTVEAVEFAGQQIELTFEVLEDVRPLITSTAIAEIGSLSLLGEAILDITPAPGGRPLNDFEYVQASQSAGYIEDVSSKASASLEQINLLLGDMRAGRGTLGKLVTEDALYRELQAFVASAGDVMTAVQEGDGTLGRLIEDPAAYNALRGSLENLQSMTARINSGQGALGRFLHDEAMGRSIAGTMTNLEQATGRMSRGEGTLGKLMTEQQLYDRLNSTIGRLDQVMTRLEKGEGTLGQLLQNGQLHENMNTAISELRALFVDIRKDPRRFLNVRVSIF